MVAEVGSDPAELMKPQITIRRLLAEEAPALSACFDRCYGRTYVVADFYDAAATAARIARGDLLSVVAVDEANQIVGHMALTIRHPCAKTVDAGNSIVDPRYRGRGIVRRLAEGVIELCREGGFLGFHHYPTTAHPVMQKLAVECGGIETGIMLDYIPAGTEYREIEGGPLEDRLGVVVVYQPLQLTPEREVFLPESLAAPIREIYTRGGWPRVLRSDSSGLPARETRLESRLDARRKLLRIEVSRIGGDLIGRVEAMLARSHAEVWQVDLPMIEPSLSAAARALRGLGFFFSAVLPEYLDGDVLRLQQVAARDASPPNLVTDEARSMLRAIFADHARAAAAA
jgi:GNAT superfamily N-acetyltransferase